MKYLAILLLFLSVLAAPVEAKKRNPLITQECGCEERFPVEDSKLAFKGKLTRIAESKQNVRGFEFYFVDLTFALEEVFRGLPKNTKEFTIRTDSTSCGYGRIVAPAGRENLVGGTFGVFSGDVFMHVCNSQLVDESWFPKNVNPLKAEGPQNRRPLGYWDENVPEGYGDYALEEMERRKKEKEEPVYEKSPDPKNRISPPSQYHR